MADNWLSVLRKGAETSIYRGYHRLSFYLVACSLPLGQHLLLDSSLCYPIVKFAGYSKAAGALAAESIEGT